MAAEHPLREAAEQLCPAIRRDRSDGLYIAYGALPAHAYFVQERRGNFTVLLPSEAGCRALRAWLGPQKTPGFAQFCERGFTAEDLRLLSAGIKLLETTCTLVQAGQYEKSVRQRAALLLRQKHEQEGGTLPLCMDIALKLMQNAKGEGK